MLSLLVVFSILNDYSTCSFAFEEEGLLLDFIAKYAGFKIYDEKARVYPLHIDRAMYLDCQSNQTALKETKEDLKAKAKLLEEQPEFANFFALLNSDED